VEDQRSPSRRWVFAAVAALVVLAAAAVAVFALGGEDEASAQTVTFQEPTDDGPDPFTKPADRRGTNRVRVGSGPFGGTGSDLVCDRELLIDSLAARPDRMREWARVLGLRPDQRVVAAYIRKLRPVTLTRDTRVTNHSFVDGRAVAFQSILQAGTAVLVDKDGVPVARCRCGNPLLEPVHIETAECTGCPPDYRPPPPCEYYDYDDRDYNRYGDSYWKRIYVRSDYADVCYLPYPDPPRVRRRPFGRPPPPTSQATNPSASFSPSAGTAGDVYTLSAAGFRPNTSLSVRLVRPDGVQETYTINTDSSGSGSYTFPPAPNPVLGTYTATVTDPGNGDTASASTSVSAATEAPPAQEQELNCDAPQSQLEFEQCRDSGQLPEQQEAPPSDYECPDQPPASPGEDYLRNCPPE
jgi:hypothetical protein